MKPTVLMMVIMANLKCCLNSQDFRNYQYTLPVVQGLVVDMEVRKTSIKIPSNRYNEVMLIKHTFVYSSFMIGIPGI